MPDAPPVPASWSKLSVRLHWLIVALIVAQLVDHEWMVDLWRATRRGIEPAQGAVIGGWIHIAVGVLVLAATALRLWDRRTHGRPALHQGQPSWAATLARVTHFLLYALLLAMPLAGLVAWFGGVGAAAEAHEVMWTVLLVLVGLHILGALVQHFWFRTDVLRRMLRPA